MKTIQINQCTQEDLEWLPGVGAATAEKIIKARPIEAKTDLEQVVPPSAWLKIQEAAVEFDFGDGKPEEEMTTEEVEAALAKAFVPVEPPITLLQEPQPLTLRRVMPGQELRQGAAYICIWNMRFGPAGEAVTPRDAAVQVEVETKLQQYNVGIQFAHYAPSVRVRTHSYGPIPLVLFEIIEETRGDGALTAEEEALIVEGRQEMGKVLDSLLQSTKEPEETQDATDNEGDGERN